MLFVAICIFCTCFSNSALFAFDAGYERATEYTSTVTASITSAEQVDWYKFTLDENQVPTPYNITLNIPDECMYNFDLRYRAITSEDRPQILSNETFVTTTRSRRMAGVLTEPGTYFVRVFSQNGTKSALYDYKLLISHNRNTSYAFGFESSLPSAESSDWSVCADILGKYTFNNIFKNSVNERNYKNAYAFISSNYLSDAQDEYGSSIKATPEQTAVATDYIFSGELMLNSKFKVEKEKIYTIEELMNYVCGLNEPIIFYLDNASLQFDIFKKYVILRDVNIGRNTITYYNPSSGNKETVDYDDFLMNGFVYGGATVNYTGTNILDANSVRRTQPVYN